MKIALARRLLSIVMVSTFLCGSVFQLSVFAQSRRQPPSVPQKKNKRPDEQKEGDEKQEAPPTDLLKLPDEEKIKVATTLVNVDAVVYNRKSGQLVPGLKKENFAIFEDGVKQEITNFATPEALLDVAVVLEFSKLSEQLGYYGSSGQDDGRREVLMPAIAFMRDSVKRGDYVSTIAYDMRPTPLTDFTNDPSQVERVINLLINNRPAFSETNLYDALKFTLIGGRGDKVVLEDPKAPKESTNKSSTADYSGLVSVQGRRRAIFLITSGIDTFSKINYDQARKITQNAGVPIYIIGTGNLFFKKYEDRLGATDSISGSPGRLTFLQAQNALRTFAEETGGDYVPITFEGEIGSALQRINALMRNQYSLAYNPGDRRDGKKHKLVVKVDVDGDGQYDDKEFIVKHRQFYNAPKQ